MNLKIDFFRKNKINPERAKKVLVDYNKDKNGNIIIKQGHFMISTSSVANYNFSDSWIFLSQPGVLNRQGVSGRMALVKSYISDKYPEDYKGSDAEITNANNFILPEIAKQFRKINAISPINKGNSRKIEESPQGATTQIEADCGTN